MERHGMCHSPEYTVWVGMIQRCTNPNAASYADYGGRGIQVCDRWRRFTAFYADVGPRPSKDYSLDRLDPDGNYEPGNAKWSLWAMQGIHKRNTKLITWRGESRCLANWATVLGIPYATLWYRKTKGMSVDEMLGSPVVPRAIRMRKLSADGLVELRAARESGATWATLGRMYGMSPQAARSACLGQTYQHAE